MDRHELDFNITRLLCQNGRASNRQLADTLGVSETLIRNRVQRLLNEEHIHVVAFPNSSKLKNGITGNIRIKTEPEKSTIIGRQLRKIKALWYIARIIGPFDLDCEFFIRSQQEIGPLRDQIEKIEGVALLKLSLLVRYLKNFMGFGLFDSPEGDESNGKAKELDHKIQRILGINGRTPTKVIARKLGVSETTIRMHVQNLIDDRHLQIVAMPNPQKLEAGITGNIRIKAKAGKTEAIGKCLKQIDMLWYIAQIQGNDDFEAEFLVKSHQDIVNVLYEIEKIQGIVHKDLSLPLSTIKHDPASIITRINSDT